MNELIKELELEAAYDTIDPNEPFNAEEFNRFTKKFAELIVKECAGIYSKIDNGNMHMGTDDYLEALHKTFRS